MPPAPDRADAPKRYILTTDAEVVRTRCEHCAKKLRVRSAHVGKQVRCPKCGQRTTVTDSSESWNDNSTDMTIEPGTLHRFRLVWIVLAVILFVAAGLFLGSWMFGG